MALLKYMTVEEGVETLLCFGDDAVRSHSALEERRGQFQI